LESSASGMARRIVKDRDLEGVEACDVAQEALELLARALRKRGLVLNFAQRMAWLAKAVEHAALRRARRERREKPAGRVWAERRRRDQVEAADDRAGVAAALARMPPDLRSVVEEFLDSGNIERVCAVTGRPRAHVIACVKVAAWAVHRRRRVVGEPWRDPTLEELCDADLTAAECAAVQRRSEAAVLKELQRRRRARGG
jgi:hypothetical protein